MKLAAAAPSDVNLMLSLDNPNPKGIASLRLRSTPSELNLRRQTLPEADGCGR